MDINVTVKGRDLMSIFKDFVSNKTMFNFEFGKSGISVQVIEDFTAERGIPFVSTNGITGNVSFTATKGILVFDSDANIDIKVNDASISFWQGGSYCIYQSEYEDRRKFPSITELQFAEIDTKALNDAVHKAIAFIPVAKELGINMPDPVFSGNKFYINCNQVALVCDVVFPECCIPMNVLRAITFKLGAKVRYYYSREKSLLCLLLKNYIFWISTADYNIASVNVKAVNEVIADLKPVGVIDVSKYKDKVDVLSNAFQKTKFTLMTTADKWSLSIRNGMSYIAVGDEIQESDIRMEISSATLNTAMKIFGYSDKVDVLRRKRCLCLSEGSIKVLIAGLIY